MNLSFKIGSESECSVENLTKTISVSCSGAKNINDIKIRVARECNTVQQDVKLFIVKSDVWEVVSKISRLFLPDGIAVAILQQEQQQQHQQQDDSTSEERIEQKRSMPATTHPIKTRSTEPPAAVVVAANPTTPIPIPGSYSQNNKSKRHTEAGTLTPFQQQLLSEMPHLGTYSNYFDDGGKPTDPPLPEPAKILLEKMGFIFNKRPVQIFITTHTGTETYHLDVVGTFLKDCCVVIWGEKARIAYSKTGDSQLIKDAYIFPPSGEDSCWIDAIGSGTANILRIAYVDNKKVAIMRRQTETLKANATFVNEQNSDSDSEMCSIISERSEQSVQDIPFIRTLIETHQTPEAIFTTDPATGNTYIVSEASALFNNIDIIKAAYLKQTEEEMCL